MQVATCPPRSQGACLDMICAYCNSPISPSHKSYVASMWHGNIYIDHCAMEGLSLAGKIQGHPADVLVTIFDLKSISPVLKWVDDFVFFHAPLHLYMDANGTIKHLYSYDLPSVWMLQSPLAFLGTQLKTKARILNPLYLTSDSCGT